jgi:hypothetical protein
MRQLISVVTVAAALAWSGMALAVVDEEKEVPVTGTEVPNATLVITDQSTGKTISTSKVTPEGKAKISIHEPRLNRKSKVTVTLTNDKGEVFRDEKGEKIERRDVTLGWIFENGIAFKTQGGKRSSEGGSRQVARGTAHVSERPRSRTVVAPAPISFQPYRGWQIGVGGDFGGATTRNRYDNFPAFDSSGVAGGGHFDARYYVVPNVFVGFNAGILAANIRGDDPDTGAFANYKWQAWEMGEIGTMWTPPGTTTPFDFYGGVGFTQGGIQAGIVGLNRCARRWME